MYCENCGKKIPDKSTFCPECGHKAINLSAKSSKKSDVLGILQKQSEGDKEYSVYWRYLLVGITSLLVLGAGFLLYWQFGRPVYTRQQCALKDKNFYYDITRKYDANSSYDGSGGVKISIDDSQVSSDKKTATKADYQSCLKESGL